MFWRIYTYVAAGRFKEWRLKTGFLRRTIKLLTDPAIARVTRTHSPRATLGKALIALWWPVQKGHIAKSGVVCVQCPSTQFMSIVEVYIHRQDVICFRLRAAFKKTKQKTAGDKSEVRSNMKVHRCHRLHTEKEERVMFSLVSAYLIWSLKSMPRQTYICSQSSIL